MAEDFFSGIEINGLFCPRGKKQVDSVTGIIVPMPETVVNSFKGMLIYLRAERAIQKPLEVLAHATDELGLKETDAWRAGLNSSSHAADKYIGAIREEMDLRTRMTKRLMEEASTGAKVVDLSAARIKCFDVAFAAESVAASVKKVYCPKIDLRPFNETVSRVADHMDAQGDLIYMYTSMAICYSRSVLPQFGMGGLDKKALL